MPDFVANSAFGLNPIVEGKGFSPSKMERI
jgi:hypothetical protein